MVILLPLCKRQKVLQKSYGLAVASLAGVPKEVIRRAKQKLKSLKCYQVILALVMLKRHS